MPDTLLILPADLGGAAFGPFPSGSHVALGSDAGQCHVAVAAGLGVAPVHAWVTLAPDGARWVQPVSATAPVFVQRGGRGPAAPVPQALQLGVGDVIALGHPQGVRFVVQDAPAATAQRSSTRLGGRRPPTAGQLGQELQRQVGARALTHGGVSQAAQLFHRARTGALLQPRYLVGAAVALLGMLATGCAGLLAAVQQAL